MRGVVRFINLFVSICRLGVGVSFSILIGAVLIQVVGRLIGGSVVWTEELTRYALLYLAAFGAGLAFRSGDLVNVDVVCESLPGRLPWLLRFFSAVVTAGLALFLLPMAWRFVSIGLMQTSPALGLRMNFVHFTVFLLLLLLGLFAVLRVVGMAIGSEDGRPRIIEEN